MRKSYHVPKVKLTGTKLEDEIRAIGLPLSPGMGAVCFDYNDGGMVSVCMERDLSEAEQKALTRCVESHTANVQRQPKDAGKLMEEAKAFLDPFHDHGQINSVLCVLACEAMKRDPQCFKRAGIDLEGDEPA